MVAAEARGFLLGPALALALGAGFVLARKPGKLPYETVSAEYLLEYGSASSSSTPTRSGAGGARARARRPARHGRHRGALCELVESLGGEVVACDFLVELAFLGGRERLRPHEVHALLRTSPKLGGRAAPPARAGRSPPPPDDLWELIGDPTTCRGGGRG